MATYILRKFAEFEINQPTTLNQSGALYSLDQQTYYTPLLELYRQIDPQKLRLFSGSIEFTLLTKLYKQFIPISLHRCKSHGLLKVFFDQEQQHHLHPRHQLDNQGN